MVVGVRIFSNFFFINEVPPVPIVGNDEILQIQPNGVDLARHIIRLYETAVV